MLSFWLLIVCNLLVERIPSLSGPVTCCNLRNLEGEARGWGLGGGRAGEGQIKWVGREGEEEVTRSGHKAASEATQTSVASTNGQTVLTSLEMNWDDNLYKFYEVETTAA